MTSLHILTLFVSASLFGTTLGQCQKAVLYSGFNGKGDNITISNKYLADLSIVNFDSRTYSVCVTGVWLLYEDSNYNPIGDSKLEYVFGRDNYCVNLKTTTGLVSSIRYAGHPNNYTADSFTIYQHDYFQGKEEYDYNEIAELDTLNGTHKSIIITGNSDWTVYDRPNFDGNSLCLRVPDSRDGTPSFIVDLQKNIEGTIPHGSIKSIRKGCLSKNNIKMASFGSPRSMFLPKK